RYAMALTGFALVILLLEIPGARADEGMWLFTQPPRDLLRTQYRFDLTDAWLERAMRASLRFNNGGSGGFVSPDGLIVSNQHIGADSLNKLSTKDKDLLRDGFYARTQAEELKCPDLELNVLQSIEDVTKEVQESVKPGMTPLQVADAHSTALSRIQ